MSGMLPVVTYVVCTIQFNMYTALVEIGTPCSTLEVSYLINSSITYREGQR